MSTDRNYNNYRGCIKSANLPCMPYLGIQCCICINFLTLVVTGVFLTDLVFIDEINPDLLPNGLINFDKWYQTARVVRDIQKFQETEYCFKPVKELARLLTNPPSLSENEIYALSLKCEERAKC
jgi:son of sevenless